MITEQQYIDAQTVVTQYEKQQRDIKQLKFKGLTEKDVEIKQGVYGRYKIPCWYIYVPNISEPCAYILDKENHFSTSLSNTAHNTYAAALKAVMSFLKRKKYINT